MEISCSCVITDNDDDFIAEARDAIARDDLCGIDGSDIGCRAGDGGNTAGINGASGGSIDILEISCSCVITDNDDDFIAEARDAIARDDLCGIDGSDIGCRAGDGGNSAGIDGASG